MRKASGAVITCASSKRRRRRSSGGPSRPAGRLKSTSCAPDSSPAPHPYLAAHAADRPAAPRGPVADNGTSGCAAPAVSPLRDTVSPNTAAGKQVGGREVEQNGGSTDPIPFDAAP